MIVLKCPNNDLGLLEFYYLESCILVLSGCATLDLLDHTQTCKKLGLLYCEKASKIKYRIAAIVCLSLLTGIDDNVLTMKHCVQLFGNSVKADMIFVQNFTPPEFQAKNCTP